MLKTSVHDDEMNLLIMHITEARIDMNKIAEVNN